MGTTPFRARGTPRVRARRYSLGGRRNEISPIRGTRLAERDVTGDRRFQHGGASENVRVCRKFRKRRVMAQLFSFPPSSARRQPREDGLLPPSTFGVPECMPKEGTGGEEGEGEEGGAEEGGGGRGAERIMLSSCGGSCTPPCAANSPRLNCLPAAE